MTIIATLTIILLVARWEWVHDIRPIARDVIRHPRSMLDELER